MKDQQLKNKVRKLRISGNTYSEISSVLKGKVSKSTISLWCKDIKLSSSHNKRIKEKIEASATAGRKKAVLINKEKRKKYLKSLEEKNKPFLIHFNKPDISKIALAMLYLGEGAKSTNGSLVFGNSNPLIIKLFLKLLRRCYKIDESKFRCTLQCRADQPILSLEKYWSSLTSIPLTQFYKARIDPRTIGKKTKKLDYKGVCRVDYFSGHIYNELTIINKILTEENLGP